MIHKKRGCLNHDFERSSPSALPQAATLSLVAILIICGLAGFLYYLRYRSTHVSTDDAFVTGRIHSVASKVPGHGDPDRRH
jgi:multidrug resistance efflux pump